MLFRSGDVSILNSASRKLIIGGTASGAYGELQLGDGSTNNAYYVTTQTGGSNDAFARKRNSSTLLYITNGGNVGIGTTSPGSKLSIVGLPTSSSGLSSGDIWNDGGTLKIVN